VRGVDSIVRRVSPFLIDSHTREMQSGTFGLELAESNDAARPGESEQARNPETELVSLCAWLGAAASKPSGSAQTLKSD
jgi:hypothetical protein